MGKFEEKIPEYLEDLEKQQSNLLSQQISMYHECDCEFCDRHGELKDEVSPEDIGQNRVELQEITNVIRSLKRYAKFCGIELKEDIR